MSVANAAQDPAKVVPAAAAAGDPNAQLPMRLLGDIVADGETVGSMDCSPQEHPDGAGQLTEAEKRYMAPPCQRFTVAGTRDLPWPPGTPVTFPAVRLSTGEPTTADGVIDSVPLPHSPYRMVRVANSGGRVIEVRCDQLAERRPR